LDLPNIKTFILSVGQERTLNIVLRLNQFGGSVGGPILKDKLFSFLSPKRVYGSARASTSLVAYRANPRAPGRGGLD
jgi:hypothetical protein